MVSGIVYLLINGTFVIWPKLSFWTLFHTPGLFRIFLSVLCRRQSIPVQVKWDTTKQSTSGSQADTLRFKRSANTYLKLLTKPKIYNLWKCLTAPMKETTNAVFWRQNEMFPYLYTKRVFKRRCKLLCNSIIELFYMYQKIALNNCYMFGCYYQTDLSSVIFKWLNHLTNLA